MSWFFYRMVQIDEKAQYTVVNGLTDESFFTD